MDAAQELAKIRQRRELTTTTRYRKSKLEKYRAELVKLRMAGASFEDLVVWLKMEHHKKVARSTVMRYLKTLPEMNTTSMAPDRDPNTVDMLNGVTDGQLQKR